MKKINRKVFPAILLVALCLAALLALGACNQNNSNVLTIGATPRPHMEILEYIRPFLLEEGIELNLVEFSDFPAVNPALADGVIDVNYFQHRPFLENFPRADELYVLGYIHIEPMGAYSYTLDSIEDLQYGAVVALPNDPANHGRALILLQTFGLLELNPDVGVRATYSSDIISNPLSLQFRSLDAGFLPRALDDPSIDMAIINTNHVLAGTDLDPVRDSLIMETPDSPFANLVAVRAEDADNPATLALLRHLQSERVRQFIYSQYNNAVLPVF